MRHLRYLSVFLAFLIIAACTAETPRQTAGPAPARADLTDAKRSISADDLLRHTKILASDEYEGRAPGTKGEDLTVTYLTEQFKRLGLKPGNPDGTYRQGVSLVGIAPRSTAALSVKDEKLPLRFPRDFVAVTSGAVPEARLDGSDIVFVGYGVVAPEFGWDDYKGIDVRGKTILMLINDPAVPDPSDPSQLDDKVFRGRAMTYYGRWTYKYEIAEEKGAAAVLIVHETGPAGYPWEVVEAGWSRERFDIKTNAKAPRELVQGWIHLDRARELLKRSGQDFDALKRAAVTKEFKPVPLSAKATFRVTNTVREVESANVVAKLEGTDLKDEYVIYTAHWDHLGRDPSLKGDQIFNGAHDNASGTAALLELAEAFTKIQPAPRRSVLFIAVTAEEQGLLGAKYYASAPLYPLERTLANINIDGMNQWGRTKDLVIVGLGNSTLDDVAQEAAKAQGRTLKPDAEPEKGYFYRSDHFEFAKEGVPALYPDNGVDYIGKPAEYGRQKNDEYTSRDYHKVSDEVKPDWDLSGAVEDTQLLLEVGYRVAQEDRWPEWKPGTEFKAKREEMLRGKT
jgi:Zn-dependent M28 family amino/carboxypeptidase